MNENDRKRMSETHIFIQKYNSVAEKGERRK